MAVVRAAHLWTLLACVALLALAPAAAQAAEVSYTIDEQLIIDDPDGVANHLSISLGSLGEYVIHDDLVDLAATGAALLACSQPDSKTLVCPRDPGHSAQISFITAGGGDDNVFVNGAIPTDTSNGIYGQAGDDMLMGGTGVDQLIGGAGADNLTGNSGSDYLYGEGDNDLVNAQDGEMDAVVECDSGLANEGNADEVYVDPGEGHHNCEIIDDTPSGGGGEPPTLTLDEVTDPTNDATPLFKGTADEASADAPFLHIWSGRHSSIPSEGLLHFIELARSGANYSYDSKSLSDGTYTAMVGQENDHGVGHSPLRAFKLDTTAPQLTLTSPSDQSTITDRQPIIRGTAGANAGSESNATADGHLTFEIQRQTASGSYERFSQAGIENGNFTAPRPTTTSGAFAKTMPSALSRGTYFMRVYQSDAAGNGGHSGGLLFTINDPAPIVTQSLPYERSHTRDTTPRLEGTASGSGHVQIELHRWTGGSSFSKVRDITTNTSAGKWGVDVPLPVSDGWYFTRAYQGNGHSGGRLFKVDTVGPRTKMTTPKNEAKVGTPAATLSGTAGNDDGDDPSVFFDIYEYSGKDWKLLKTHQITRKGTSWSFKLPYNLRDTWHYVYTYQKDAAGNVGPHSGSQFEVNTSQPDVPTKDNPGTNGKDCQKELSFGPLVAKGGCLKREGLTWVATGEVELNGIKFVPGAGNAKVIFDPLNLRVAATGKVKVQLGPAYLYGRQIGPVTLYEGSFDWEFQPKVKLPDLPQFGMPTSGGKNLPSLPGLGGFGLPNLQIPGFGGVNLPDFSKIKGLDIGKLEIPTVNLPYVQIPQGYVPKFELPRIGVGTSGATSLFGFPFEGRAGVKLVDNGAQIDVAVKLPGIFKGVGGSAVLFIGKDGSFRAENMHFSAGFIPLGPISFEGIEIDYKAENNTWDGKGTVNVPFPPDGLGISVGATFQNGQLVNASGGFRKNIPLGPVMLYSIDAYFKSIPRMEAGGSIEVGIGPQVKPPPPLPTTPISAVGVKGTMSYLFPAPGKWGKFTLGGEVKLVGIKLASGKVVVWEHGGVDFDAKFGHKVSGFGITANVDGWVTKGKFRVDGSGQLTLPGDVFKLGAEATVSSAGMGACAQAKGFWGDYRLGGTYLWASRKLDIMWNSCSIGSSIRIAKPTARAAGTTQTIQIGKDEPVKVIGIKGTTAPPVVTVRGPKGETATGPVNGQGVDDGRFLIVPNPTTNETMVGIAKPSAGTWTIEVEDGSSPVESIATADALPKPEIDVTVGGKGLAKTLTYDIKPQKGMAVEFVEETGQGNQPIGTAKRNSGTLRWSALPGKGTSQVFAIISQDGNFRDKLEVAKFSTPAAPKLAAPARVGVNRKGKKLATTWAPVAGAKGYQATVVMNGGRKQVFQVKAAKLTVKDLYAGTKAKVTVAALDKFGRPGKARTGQLKLKRPKPVGKKPKKKPKRRP